MQFTEGSLCVALYKRETKHAEQRSIHITAAGIHGFIPDADEPGSTPPADAAGIGNAGHLSLHGRRQGSGCGSKSGYISIIFLVLPDKVEAIFFCVELIPAQLIFNP